MHRARRIPSPDENKQSNEKVQQADHPQVILHGNRLMCGSGDQAGFKLFAVARKFVAELRPEACPVEAARDVRRIGNGGIIDREENVTWADARARRGRIGSHTPGFDAVGAIRPGNTVIDEVKLGALAEIEPAVGHRRQRRQREDDRTYPDS